MTYRLPIFAFLSLLLWWLPATTDASDYIDRLQTVVTNWQDELPSLKKSADAAAEKILAGGHLFLGMTQESFAMEMNCRSGGPMLSALLLPDTALTDKDVILTAAISQSDKASLAALLDRAQRSGAQVILFSASYPPQKGLTIFTPALSPAMLNQFPSVESVSNVVGAWTWTGEFVRACLDRGKMPCMYESIWMPGGKARDNALAASPFHANSLKFPYGAPDLGKLYLTALSESLSQLKKENAQALPSAKALLQSALAKKEPIFLLSTAHIFPAEMTSNPVPSAVTIAPQDYVPRPDAVTIFLGYQWFPWEIASLSGKDRAPCIVTSSRPPAPDWLADKDHIYLNPCWAVQDAAVTLPGYDVNILPISGIMQSAIFWELMEGLTPPDAGTAGARE